MGFYEILVIALIALFVVGPERLPETVREISLWIGRLKRGLRDARAELEQQIGADEIRRTLHNENVLKSLENVKRDVEDTFNQDIGQSIAPEDDDLNLPPHDPNNDIDDEAEAVQSIATQEPNTTNAKSDDTEPEKSEETEKKS